MTLSQARTRTTLKFIFLLPETVENEEWLKTRLTANGLSSSRPIKNKNLKIDEEASQRVEFRIVTNADEKLETITKSILKIE